LQENHFEPAFFDHFPELRMVKAEWLAAGAVMAGLTGSGSAMFGLFKHKRELARAVSRAAGLDLRFIQTHTLRRAAYHSGLVESLQ
jgi:4-diphosphocytidyl-2-C-methyl-D-erythritol kinase